MKKVGGITTRFFIYTGDFFFIPMFVTNSFKIFSEKRAKIVSKSILPIDIWTCAVLEADFVPGRFTGKWSALGCRSTDLAINWRYEDTLQSILSHYRNKRFSLRSSIDAESIYQAWQGYLHKVFKDQIDGTRFMINFLIIY